MFYVYNCILYFEKYIGIIIQTCVCTCFFFQLICLEFLDVFIVLIEMDVCYVPHVFPTYRTIGGNWWQQSHSLIVGFTVEMRCVKVSDQPEKKRYISVCGSA